MTEEPALCMSSLSFQRYPVFDWVANQNFKPNLQQASDFMVNYKQKIRNRKCPQF